MSHQGFRQEGVDDLLSGALMGAYHTGGGSGPLIGGAAKHAVGFPWSGAVFAAILVAHGVAILILRGVMPPEPAFADLDTDKLAAISGARVAGFMGAFRGIIGGYDGPKLVVAHMRKLVVSQPCA